MFNRNDGALGDAAMINATRAIKEVARLREQVEALSAEIERLKPLIDRPTLTVKKDARKDG